MFLTTNRVFAFDPAIRSRISIAIKYNPLKKIARKQVWQQLLEMANGKISPADMDELSMSPVNGRYITCYEIADCQGNQEHYSLCTSIGSCGWDRVDDEAY
jgi:hypothetical protein